MPEIDTTQLDKELSESVTDNGGLFCGVREEQFAIGGITYSWIRGAKLKWGVEFSRLGNLSRDDIISNIKFWLKNEFESNGDIFFEFVEGKMSSNIWLTAMRLDGKSGVLADMQIPPQNAKPQDTQLIGRFDDSENYGLYENPPSGTIDFERTAKHEWEHALGIGHRPPSITKPALIAPIYSPTMRNLQAADVEEIVRRYGPAKTATNPPVSGTSKPVNCKVVHEIEQNGKRWKGTLSGILMPVN